MRVCYLVALVLVVMGCSTGYHASNFLRNGYSETKTSDSTFIVRFEGNEWTEISKAKNYAMLRAAELTVQHGFEYFTIVSEWEDIQKNSMADQYEDPFDAFISWCTEGKGEPLIELSIQCFHEKPLNKNGINAANFLIKNKNRL